MRFSVIIILIFIAGELNAQNYTRDYSIRCGDQVSAGYRQFYDDEQAVEAMFSFGRRGMKITILKEHTMLVPAHFSDNVHFIYGYGAHAGFRYADRYRVLNRTYKMDDFRFMPLLGLDGMVGIEYRFQKFPIIAGFDLKPYFEYSTIQIFNLFLNSFGFSLKYRF